MMVHELRWCELSYYRLKYFLSWAILQEIIVHIHKEFWIVVSDKINLCWLVRKKNRRKFGLKFLFLLIRQSQQYNMYAWWLNPNQTYNFLSTTMKSSLTFPDDISKAMPLHSIPRFKFPWYYFSPTLPFPTRHLE